MIEEWRSDFSTEVSVHRCINCGLVLDPLITKNRLLKVRAKQPVLDAA
jgi:hypothetical protein